MFQPVLSYMTHVDYVSAVKYMSLICMDWFVILSWLTTSSKLEAFSQGNRLFKEGKFELAKAKYDKVWLPLDLQFVVHKLSLIIIELLLCYYQYIYWVKPHFFYYSSVLLWLHNWIELNCCPSLPSTRLRPPVYFVSLH